MLLSDEEETRPAPVNDRRARKAVIYVTSQSFLYPTLVSALQVNRQVDAATTDVILFLIEVGEENMRLARSICAEHRISVGILEPSLFSLPQGVQMLPSHVPPASLARLVVQQILDPIYDRVLYLDGDTLVTGDIRPLLAFDPPRGTIGAVRGSVWLSRTSSGRTPVDAYVEALGLQHPDNYFNAGILSCWRADLEHIGANAFAYFIDNPHLCRFHDQSALNHVCDGRVTELWPGFNYHVPYQNLLPVHAARPALVHFTGPVKPWTCRVNAFAAVYDRFDDANPSVAHWRGEAPRRHQRKIARKLFRQTLRERLRVVTWLRRRRRLGAYLESFGDDIGRVRPGSLREDADTMGHREAA